MVSRESVCLRRLAEGRRREIVGFGRFLANRRVTVESLIEGWGSLTSQGCEGRHVLAIQDLSEVKFPTSSENRRGLGKVGKGNSHGVLLHAMLAVDADDGGCLGLVSGQIWSREGPITIPHPERPLSERESYRWLTTAEAAKSVLAKAACVTVVADRESDIYAEWALLPGPNFHLLTRATADRRIVGGNLSTATLKSAGTIEASVQAATGRPAHDAILEVRYGPVSILRPNHAGLKEMPQTIDLHLVEANEPNPPKGAKPILWRLLTTHDVSDADAALRILGWYRRRWIIEQLFRTLKQQGLKIEDSQVEDAERLVKLAAIATAAACAIMQLVQARDGKSGQPAGLVFSPSEIATLRALIPTLEGKTLAQKNPHPPGSLAWGAWAVAKLGGWDGYGSSKPPGPITFRHGLEYFRAIAVGRQLRDV